MRRMLGVLTIALTVGCFGGPRPASAAAFLWISAPNFTYSAAACVAPPAGFYAWFLSVGAGSYSYAWTACASPWGASGSIAAARAGVGGFGAAFAAGWADPYSGVGIDSGLSDSLITGENYTSQSSQSGAEGELSSQPAYTVGTNGITFNNETQDELNGVDELAAFYAPALDGDSATTICDDFGGSDCASPGSGSVAAGDVTDLATFETDTHLTPLATWTDPTDNDDNWNFSIPSADLGDIIIVGQGDDASVPEPGSILLLGQGLVGLGLMVARRRRRRA